MGTMISIVRDPAYLKHSAGAGHPEKPERLKAINDMIENHALKNEFVDTPAREASLAELAWIHSTDHIERVQKTAKRELTRFDMETAANSNSYQAALRAVGGALEAVKAVLEHKSDSAFAFVRPPGHHAERAQAMGFCLFNNIAVAACYAIESFNLQRVLIIDWDVHHGNGTMHSFYDSDKVLYFSVHEHPHYPGTGRIDEIGRGPGEGFTLNVPLAPGQQNRDYLAVMRYVLEPIALEYDPDLVLISAGFDAHLQDPLANMKLSSDGFGEMMRIVNAIAEKCCQNRTVLVLEGGYDLQALAQSVSKVLSALLGPRSEQEQSASSPAGSSAANAIDATLSLHKNFWNL